MKDKCLVAYQKSTAISGRSMSLNLTLNNVTERAVYP